MSLVTKSIIISMLALVLFSCNRITERRTDYAVHGIDVSRYQTDINWESIDKENIHFAFIKATEGQELVDKYFCTNWNMLEEKGIKKGAYHFFRPSISAEVQFLNYCSQVSLNDGDLPPVLDFEATGNLDDIAVRNKLEALLHLFKNHYATLPILYTNLKLYNKFVAGHFDDYPIWIARYSDQTPQLHSEKTWTFWQYGNRGRVPGIVGDVDLNVFHGSMEELNALSVKATGLN